MTEQYTGIALHNNKTIQHFELKIEGKIAFVEYAEQSGHLSLLHTEVPNELAGKGVASTLVKKIFQQIEAQGQKARIYCPYIAAWVKKHPEYESLTV